MSDISKWASNFKPELAFKAAFWDQSGYLDGAFDFSKAPKGKEFWQKELNKHGPLSREAIDILYDMIKEYRKLEAKPKNYKSDITGKRWVPSFNADQVERALKDDIMLLDGAFDFDTVTSFDFVEFLDIYELNLMDTQVGQEYFDTGIKLLKEMLKIYRELERTGQIKKKRKSSNLSKNSNNKSPKAVNSIIDNKSGLDIPDWIKSFDINKVLNAFQMNSTEQLEGAFDFEKSPDGELYWLGALKIDYFMDDTYDSLAAMIQEYLRLAKQGIVKPPLEEHVRLPRWLHSFNLDSVHNAILDNDDPNWIRSAFDFSAAPGGYNFWTKEVEKDSFSQKGRTLLGQMAGDYNQFIRNSGRYKYYMNKIKASI